MMSCSTPPIGTLEFNPLHRPKRRHYTLFMLMVVYTFSTIDKQIVGLLAEPIRFEFGFSDTQMGLVAGLAVALSYLLLGLAVAVLADRFSRRNIIAIALFVWGMLTILGGFAFGVWTLVMSRIAQEAVEAGTTAPTHSMIADLYSEKRRSAAFGVYFLGVYPGIMIGFLLGAYVAQTLGWRAAFVVVGLCGLVLALLVRFTVAEPARGASDGIEVAGSGANNWLRMLDAFPRGLRHLLTDPVSRNVTFGVVLLALFLQGSAYWIPTFLIRVHGMTLVEVGTYLAFSLSISGGLGVVCGGFLADWASRRHAAGGMWLIALTTIVVVPLKVIFLLAANLSMGTVAHLLAVFLAAFYLGPTFAMIQTRSPLRMRTLSAAIVLIATNLLGAGFGPQLVGILSDAFATEYGQESLRYALLLLSFISVWGGYHYYLAGKHLVSADAK